MIDPNSRIPLYYQLLDILIDQINSGELKVDDKLPSERELCDKYNISRATVRQTMAELEQKGYIYRKQGRGTFITIPFLKQELEGLYSFSEEMKKIGKTPTNRVVEFSIIKADDELAGKMQIRAGEEIIQFIRLRLADQEPMMYVRTYLPYASFPMITPAQLESRSLYRILEEDYNTLLVEANEKFRPAFPNEDEIKYLKISEKLPCMRIERTTRSQTGIVEYTVGIARGDKFEYSVVLRANS